MATDHDRGSLLAAILGIFSRPGLDTAPGLLVDAPCQSSGKTLLAQSLGALLLGKRAPITPFGGDDDIELKKLLVSNALGGFDWLLLDNVTGSYDSATLAAYITSGNLRERILGASLTFDGDVSPTVVLTSNNGTLSRDLASRFIRVRIDTRTERPQGLEFSFDPIERALQDRLPIARAACTLFQGFLSAGSPRLGRGDARFTQWSRLVRSCVLWLESEGLPEAAGVGHLSDPAWMILELAGKDDPESQALAQLLEGLTQAYPGGEPFYARDVLQLCNLGVGAGRDVKEAVESLIVNKGPLTTRTVGKILSFRVDRIADGMVLRARPAGKHAVAYGVQTA